MANLGFFLAEAWRDTLRRPLAMFFSLLSISLLLFFVGLVLAGGQGVRGLVGQLRQEAAITVFLREELAAEELPAVQNRLEEMAGVMGVTFVSREEALEEMTDVLGDYAGELTALAGFNPFLSYFEVAVEPELGVEVAGLAQGLPGVDSVRDNRQTLERLARLTMVVQVGGVLVLAFVGLLLMMTISHIVHLGLLAREEEMALYRLLGAEPWFGLMPFLLQGTLVGLLGGALSFVLSLLCLPALFGSLERALPFLPLPGGWEVAWALGPILLAAGAGFACCGSILAQFRLSEG